MLFYRFPNHEIQIKNIALEMGFEHVSLSSEVMPMLRIVPRGHTGIYVCICTISFSLYCCQIFVICMFINPFSLCGCLPDTLYKEIC